MTEMTEVVFRWHCADGIATIARALGVDRKTVHKFVNTVKG